MKFSKKSILIIISIVSFILIFILAIIFGYNFIAKIILNDKPKSNTPNVPHLDTSNIEVVCNSTNPVIPVGFHKVETDTASWEIAEDGTIKGWNDGLVIEDDMGNQFVWIPYDSNTKGYKTTKEQIYKYSGFYISRYEAGLPDELSYLKNNISEKTNNIKGVPVSKKGAIVWNYIGVNNAYYNAQNMYPENPYFSTEMLDTESEMRVSSFITIKDYNTDVYNIERKKFYFSGYYSLDNGKNYEYVENMEKNGQMLLSAGASDECKKKNIYDFYGNLADTHITSISKYGYKYAVSRGDSYRMNNEDYYKDTGFYHPRDYQGFRIALYMK